jgi:hypothetical protein
MSAESVALIPQCAECGACWLPADEECWRAYLGSDTLDEPAEVVFYCPDCAEREFGDELRDERHPLARRGQAECHRPHVASRSEASACPL